MKVKLFFVNHLADPEIFGEKRQPLLKFFHQKQAVYERYHDCFQE